MGAVGALKDGKLRTSTEVLYEVPSGKNVRISVITFVNTDTTARTANLLINRMANLIHIFPKDMTMGKGFLAETDKEYHLNPGDQILGNASINDVIEFTISGEIEP